jgi:hypothetical protein
VNSLVYACLALIVGVQLVLFGGFAEIYGQHEGITGDHHLARWTRLLRLETCMAVGLVLMLAGGIGTVVAFSQWGAEGFGPIGQTRTIRWVLGSTTAISLGVIIVCAGLFSSLLTLRSARPARLIAVDDEDEDERLPV